jgi:hypothetical protein
MRKLHRFCPTEKKKKENTILLGRNVVLTFSLPPRFVAALA